MGNLYFGRGIESLRRTTHTHFLGKDVICLCVLRSSTLFGSTLKWLWVTLSGFLAFGKMGLVTFSGDSFLCDFILEIVWTPFLY